MAKQYQHPKAPDQTGDDVVPGASTPPDEAVVDTTVNEPPLINDVPTTNADVTTIMDGQVVAVPDIKYDKPVRPTKITSHEEAVEYVLNFFNVPAGVRTIWVCEDTNIFYRGNPAEVHAREQNIKLFAIQWD